MLPQSSTTCAVPECDRPARSRGWCNKHYECWRLTGNPISHQHILYREWWKGIRFLHNGCWVWQHAVGNNAHGQVWDPSLKRLVQVYRVVYEFCCGPIPEGLELDHLCGNPRCVNPDHLEPVTHAENMHRAEWGAPQHQRAKTHCPRGHPYAGENLYVNPKGRRECRICRAASRKGLTVHFVARGKLGL